MLLHSKIAIGVGSLLLATVAAGGTYKAITGECPCAAICHAIHGDSTPVAKTTTPPTTAN